MNTITLSEFIQKLKTFHSEKKTVQAMLPQLEIMLDQKGDMEFDLDHMVKTLGL